MGIVIALGGEEIGKPLKGKLKPVKLEAAHREVLLRTGKKHPKVLYIPTAKDDNEGYIAGFRQYYAGLGCREVEVLRLIRNHPSVKEIGAKIFSADAIYVNGGNTYRMLRIWRQYNMEGMLKRAYQKGTVMTGHSAGAICWFAYGNSDSFLKKRPFRLKALGIVNALMCPHYDSEPARQSALKRMMKRTAGMVAVALDEYAAIEIIGSTYRILSATPSSMAHRTFWKKGRYVVEDVGPTRTFQDLNTLLDKPA